MSSLNAVSILLIFFFVCLSVLIIESIFCLKHNTSGITFLSGSFLEMILLTFAKILNNLSWPQSKRVNMIWHSGSKKASEALGSFNFYLGFIKVTECFKSGSCCARAVV